MRFEKGNKEQLKAKNPGRKTLKEELANYKEKLKEMSLEELAASKVYKAIDGDNTNKTAKEIALPVYLKSKADKTINTTQVTVEGIDYIKPHEDTNKAH